MRIAVLSDIHGNLEALKAVLRDLADRRVDTIVNLGDSLSGPLQPSETAAFLMAQPWPQLAGNHERQLLDFAPERRGSVACCCACSCSRQCSCRPRWRSP